MFFYDNNKICVIAWPRCGHTSMYKHFNLPVYSTEDKKLYHFVNSKATTKIVVIRNPYDRLLSAIKNSKILEARPIQDPKHLGFDWKHWAISHSEPVLHELTKLNIGYKIIDFYKLNNYINVAKETIVTNSVASNTWEDYMSTYFSKEQMEKEYQAYLSIMISHDEISVPEWKLMVDF